jgi:hypothetical protein
MRHGFAATLTLWVACLWCGIGSATAPEHELEAVRAETMRPYAGPATEAQPQEGLQGKILCGYQGWFNTPDDGASLGWKHWFRDAKRPPVLDTIGIDILPDVSELAPEARHATALIGSDGRPVELFSSFHPQTVDRHFQWMREYGIDGVFVQRFAAPLASPRHLRNCTIVLDHCRAAANRHGRAYAVMYDLSGLKAGGAAEVIADWKALRTRMQIGTDPAYLRLGGKPLVAVWGIGFGDKRAYGIADCREILAALKADGCAVMGGIPTGWRTLNRDALPDKSLHEVVAMCDVVSPWTVGRYRTPDEVSSHATRDWTADIEWCRGRSLLYMPVAFPGFSWHNLHGGPVGQIPRRKGEFLWRQFAEASRAGAKTIYVAMFDEVDEGTAIFKCADPPAGEPAKRLLSLEGMPSDHYLRLTGEAAKLLRAGTPLPDQPPL